MSFFRKLIHPAIILLFSLAPISAFAHPHILIDAQVTFTVNKTNENEFQLTKLHYIWQFDENFSLLLLGDYDDNQDQLLDQDELSTMGIETMEGAKALGYFTFISNANETIPPTDAPQVRASFSQNRLTLEFDLELPSPVIINNNLSFSLFDEEYYTAFYLKPETGFKIDGINAANCNIYQAKIAEIDENIAIALENAFTQDTTNQGLGAQFADKVGIKCG